MISKKEWWCGCDPDIKFSNEKEFVRHMKDKHESWARQELPKLMKVV